MSKRIGWMFCAILFLLMVNGGFVAASAEKPIVLGCPTSMSYTEGKECYRAAQLAVEEINSQGGVLVGGEKRPFKIEPIDIRDAEPGVPVSEALMGIEKLIISKKPDALIVGPFRSEAMLASMDVFAKYKIPFISSLGMSYRVEKRILENPEKYKYIFRTDINTKFLMMYFSGMMDFLKAELGFKKIYFMVQDVVWARAMGKGTAAHCEGSGWTVLGTEAYPTGMSDFSSGLIKVKNKKADFICAIFDMPQSGILLKQWSSMKIPALIGGFISPLAAEDAWETFGGKIEGAMNSVFEIGNVPVNKVPKSVEFYEKYLKRWGKLESGHAPSTAYDAVYVLKKAMERADTLDSDKVVSEIEKTDMNGAIGRIRFGKDHATVYGFDPNETALGAFIQWQKPGKRVCVYPALIADKKISFPSWMEKRD
jgi:branched-chain amino acid transport system substrate-binding protein